MESRYKNFETLSPGSGNPNSDVYNEGVSSIKGIPPHKNLEHPLPRPENPETLEVSQSSEAKLGRDDGQHVVVNDTSSQQTASIGQDDSYSTSTDLPPAQDNPTSTPRDMQTLSSLGRAGIQGNLSSHSPTDQTDKPDVPLSQEQLAINELKRMPEIQPDSWRNLNENERIDSLQNIENVMANIQKRPPSEVKVASAGPGQFGFFDPQTGDISVGSYSLQFASAQENADTIVHEGRHAYQQYAIDHPGHHPDRSEVESWRENMKPGNYMSAQEYGQEIYQSQPIEADAWNYSRKIANGVYGDT